MSKNYEIELSEESIKGFTKELDKIEKKITNDSLNKFLMDKCRDTLEYIMHNENVEGTQRGSEYIEGNHEEKGKGYIRLYNDSVIDIEGADTFLSEEAKETYPSRLSLAALMEYGTGLRGAESSKNTGDEWEYMVRPNRDYREGWDWNNQSYSDFPSHTEGQEGKYIYFQLHEQVVEHIDEWMIEYFDKVLGGSL